MKNGDANGWRRLVDAQGIVEFENASVKCLGRKLDKPTTFPLPDGRMVERIYIDYVTMNGTLDPFGVKCFDYNTLGILSTSWTFWV